VADLCGDKGEPILLAVFVFLLGTCATAHLAFNLYIDLFIYAYGVLCRHCSIRGDVLALHPGGQGEVRLRRDHLHTHLQPGGRVELPRRGAHQARAPALLHHRRRRLGMPRHHRLRLPRLGRGGPTQARCRQPRQTGRVPSRYVRACRLEKLHPAVVVMHTLTKHCLAFHTEEVGTKLLIRPDQN
jgi:hypothetical protein